MQLQQRPLTKPVDDDRRLRGRGPLPRRRGFTDRRPSTTGCTGKTYTGSCHGDQAAPNPTSACNDYYGWDVNSAKLTCQPSSGVFNTTPCDTAKNVGSCEKLIAQDKVCVMYWYFDPYTSDTVQQGCPAPSKYHAP